MTPEYARMALPLIQALADGKALEQRCIGGTNWFAWAPHEVFYFLRYEYRVKPPDPRAKWREAVHALVTPSPGNARWVYMTAERREALEQLLNNIPKEE